MAQITSGIRSLLSFTSIYRLVQNLFGGSSARTRLVHGYFEIERVDSILDIGCGPGNILEVLPTRISYTGFDASEKYISHAKEKYRDRNAEFHARYLDESDAMEFSKFDLVLAMGILHHLEDDEARALFSLAGKCLNEDGLLFTIDPCYVPDQRMLAKLFIDNDRGQNVRPLQDYAALARTEFSTVKVDHLNDLSRFPYDHAVMVCKKVQ